YDQVGRPAGVGYPGVPGFGSLFIVNDYSGDGFLNSVHDVNGLGIRWDLRDTDVFGEAADWQSGPFSVLTRRDPDTGLLRYQHAEDAAGHVQQELAVDYGLDDTVK